jgi:short-subunit dehydrogenase
MRNLLITGASSGLGAALARTYAAQGTRLILWGRNEQRLNDTATQCRVLGAMVETDSFDLTDITKMMSRIQLLDERAPIDLVIFNAGIGGSVPESDLAEAPKRSHAMAMMNFASPVIGSTVLAETMAQRRHGHIVLVGSVAEIFPLPMAPSYAGAKAGLAMFAEALRLRMSKYGVVVTLVSPGFIDTPMSRDLTTPKPFLMSADSAAARIAKKIERHPARIVIPWPFAIICAVARVMPRSIIAAVLRRV